MLQSNDMGRPTGIVALSFAALALSGCVTRALLRLGDPDDPPAAYDAVSRDGGVLLLHYSAIAHDGEIREADDEEEVALASLVFRPVGVGPMDPACMSTAWSAAPSTGPLPVPAVTSGALDREAGAAVHAKIATGSPPLSVHFSGLDFRVFCGAGDAMAYAEFTHPPAETGKPAGAIAAIVFLFPLALVADACGGFIGYFATK